MSRSDENLLSETIEALAEEGKTPADVRWVGASVSGYPQSVWMTWDEFARATHDLTYDSSYGAQEINETLVVVGDAWWLERHEYDGSEWWEYKTAPLQATSSHLSAPDARVFYVEGWAERWGKPETGKEADHE